MTPRDKLVHQLVNRPAHKLLNPKDKPAHLSGETPSNNIHRLKNTQYIYEPSKKASMNRKYSKEEGYSIVSINPTTNLRTLLKSAIAQTNGLLKSLKTTVLTVLTLAKNTSVKSTYIESRRPTNLYDKALK